MRRGRSPDAWCAGMNFACYLTIRTGRIQMIERLWIDEEGQDLVEYGLLLVLVSLGAVAAMGTLASAISDAFSNASSNLSSS